MLRLLALASISLLCGTALAQKPAAPPPQNPAAPATQPAAPSESGASGVVGGKNATYTDRMPEEQIVALDANGDKFQARYIADLSGQPRGAVIILHDSGQHPNWPFTAAALIDDLPLHGWNTLNIELPPPKTETAAPAALAPTAAPATPPAPVPAAPANTAPAAAAGIEPQAQARINAAIKFFSDQNQRNVVLIGFGSGAFRAAENLRAAATANPATPGATAPTGAGPISALVMIAPQQRLDGSDMNLPKLLPLTAVPALDLVLDSDIRARGEAEARRRAVLHQRMRVYTRIELPPLNGASDAQHAVMVKRVRSWLQVNAQAAR